VHAPARKGLANVGELALQRRDLLLERVDPDTDVATLAERVLMALAIAEGEL